MKKYARAVSNALIVDVPGEPDSGFAVGLRDHEQARFIADGINRLADKLLKGWIVKMTNEQRTKLRKLQDDFLALAVVKNQVRNFGEDHPIASPDSPTFKDVRTMLLPEWEQWFADFFV